MDNPVWGNSIFKKKKKGDDIFALLIRGGEAA